MTRGHAAASVAAVLLLGGARLCAQVDDSLQLTLDLGFVSTAGNTAVTTLNFGEHLSYSTDRWILSHFVTVVEGRSNGEETAAQYKTAARADRAFSTRLGAYALGGFERNVFAGIAQRYEEGAGLTAKAVAQPRDQLSLEAGISFIQQRSVARVRDTFGAGRAAARYRHGFGEATYFQQDVELLANLQNSDDRRVNMETALVAPISQHIALKAAYLVRFDNQPEPGFRKSDRVFTTGIQIVF
jgi:putative salt-induced outer membrane protein YdiY